MCKTSILPFPVVDRCRNRPGSVSSRWAWSKTPDLPLELSICHPICHSSRDISISGFGGRIAISGGGHSRNHCRNHGDPLFGLAMVENPDLPLEFRRYLFSSSGITISGFGRHVGCRSML